MPKIEFWKNRHNIFLRYNMIESCELNESTKNSNISYSEAQFNANYALVLSENWLSRIIQFFTSISCSFYSFLAKEMKITKFYLKILLNCLQSYRTVFKFLITWKSIRKMQYNVTFWIFFTINVSEKCLQTCLNIKYSVTF